MYKSVNKEYIKIIRICVHAQCEQKQNKDITEKKQLLQSSKCTRKCRVLISKLVSITIRKKYF